MVFSVISSKNNRAYYLNAKENMLAGGRMQVVYYFTSSITENGIDAMPEGFEVFELKANGFPMLRKVVKTP